MAMRRRRSSFFCEKLNSNYLDIENIPITNEENSTVQTILMACESMEEEIKKWKEVKEKVVLECNKNERIKDMIRIKSYKELKERLSPEEINFFSSRNDREVLNNRLENLSKNVILLKKKAGRMNTKGVHINQVIGSANEDMKRKLCLFLLQADECEDLD